MGKRLTAIQTGNILTKYMEGASCLSLAIEFGVSHGTVHNVVTRFQVNRHRRKDHFNERFFTNIDTDEKAYWLGFLYADGNVWENTVGVSLASVDIQHLKKLRDALASNAELRYRKDNDSWTVKFHSKLMANTLMEWGIMPAKSHIIKTPKLSNHLMNHFYRGYFDGDGWITRRRNTWSVGVASGSKTFLCGFHRWWIDQIDSDAAIVERKDANAYQFVFEGNRIAKQALSLIYSYSEYDISLDRKRALALEILS